MPTTRTFRSRSSDHVPVVPTMVSTGGVGVKRIHVYRNADAFFPGIQVVVNTHRVPSMNVLLDVISERIGLINGAKKLYTTGGTQIKDINKIRDGESYVASSSHFTPMSYGGQQAVAKEKPKKTKKKRSKTVHDTERKLVEEEVIIPLNDGVEKVEKRVKKTKKSVKKKMVPHHHGSNETLADTVEVELPSELEDSEEEEADEHSKRERSFLQSPEPSRPSTAFRHNADPPRSASRRGSRKDNVLEQHENAPDEKKKERKKSVSKRRKSRATSEEQPNWGDLSSFTKNIESLLKH